MTAADASVTDLTARLRAPLTLADILSAARHPAVMTAASLARLVERWAEDAGKAKDALLCAPAADLAALITGEVGFPDFCESCRAPLPGWVESVRSDVPLSYCVTCAVVDQRANPQDWREYLADRDFDVFGGGHDG